VEDVRPRDGRAGRNLSHASGVPPEERRIKHNFYFLCCTVCGGVPDTDPPDQEHGDRSGQVAPRPGGALEPVFQQTVKDEPWQITRAN